MNQYVQPTLNADAFHCPHCQVYTHHAWWASEAGRWGSRGGVIHGLIKDLLVSYCQRCGEYCLWVGGGIVYPAHSTAPFPTTDMPDDVKADYVEACGIFDRSPRSAAALLRLALQKLMPHLNEKGKNINDDIGSLVQKGMPPEVQKALDTVRVVGNNAVHPGQIDVNDNRETAAALFGLLNFIVERLITHKKHVDELYAALPQSQRDAIAKRDGKK